MCGLICVCMLDGELGLSMWFHVQHMKTFRDDPRVVNILLKGPMLLCSKMNCPSPKKQSYISLRSLLMAGGWLGLCDGGV